MLIKISIIKGVQKLKAVIFYFTGTGNNLRVAKGLQKELGKVDLFPIRYLKTKKEVEEVYTHVIFIVPSYYSHIPNFVRECLKKVTFTKEQRVVSIVDCGGNRGRAIEDLRECIKACGKEVAGEYMVMHPGNYILSYNAFPMFYQKVVNRQADKKINQIAQAIKTNRLTTLKRTGIFYSKKFEVKLQEKIAAFHEVGKQYEVSNECIGCGICQKICPTCNIHIENGKPVFENGCQQCMACIQWCPNKAIDYKHKAEKRTRYHHQAITLKELIEANRI